MKATDQKIEQSNWYNVFDSMGRRTEIYYIASNINDAYKAFKADRPNFQKYYYGKLKRCYNGGVRGSSL
jgi:hypothetical protein